MPSEMRKDCYQYRRHRAIEVSMMDVEVRLEDPYKVARFLEHDQ